MSFFRLILSALLYHGRTQAAVGLGVAAGTAVLTGALLVGDSMRESLRRLTLDRLGRIDEALVADHFFRARLADELASARKLDPQSDVAPVILLTVPLGTDDPDHPARVNHVNLIGCDARFWRLGHGVPAQLPQGLQVLLNEPLAERLGAAAGKAVTGGESVSIVLPQSSEVPSESMMGRRRKTIVPQRFTVCGVIPADGLGRFTLSPNQQLPYNAYVPLDWLQDRIKQPGRANALLVADARSESAGAPSPWHPRLEDYGIVVRQAHRGYFNITSERMILDPQTESAICRRLDGLTVQPALTYVANTIALGERSIPYSTIAAVDFTDRPPLGPLQTPKGKPIAPLGPDEIVLNSWAATNLGAKPGDSIRVSYFEPESIHGVLREKASSFRLAAIAELSGAAADREFTPEVPGVTDRKTINNWDPPFPFDSRRIRPQDEDYWRQYRTTPKAFVSLATGQRLWGSRFGQVTSIRVAPNRNAAASEAMTVERLAQRIDLDPQSMGFVLQPIKRQGLAASLGATPFEWLFLGFSSFIIASAAMLVALLFGLGIVRRGAEIGLLLAVGFRQRQVRRMLVAEGFLVAAVGSLVGVFAGIGYAWLMLAGLESWWLDAVVTPFLRLAIAPSSLVVGYASGLVIACGAIAWSARRIGRIAPRRLLAGETSLESAGKQPRQRFASVLFCALLGVAFLLGLAAVRLGQEAQAGAFFTAGMLVLTAVMVLVRSRLAAGRTGPAVAAGRGNLFRLAIRSAARHPGRSTLTIGLVAAASFLIAAVSAFQTDPSQQGPDLHSGNGGFTLVAQSDQPIYADWNTPDGRADLGFPEPDAALLSNTTTIALRMKPGDDASCLNLYRPQQPRILGVPPSLVARGGFSWASTAPPPALGRHVGMEIPDQVLMETSVEDNPWMKLYWQLPPDGDIPRIPVVLEENTAIYSLHLGGVGATCDITDGRGLPLRLEVVGLLSESVFQGDLLIREADFLRYFPEQSGYRFFLIETPADRTVAVQDLLERTLGEYGFSAETTGHRLARFLAVQNTYLSTFQSLGGLGLLLGTIGLAAVQVRSVLERRREFALLQATGFRRESIAQLVMLENGVLLTTGLGAGILAALVAVLPHFLAHQASIPWLSLAGMLTLVLVVGFMAGLAAVRAALSTPILASLHTD
jgi:ABC-type lipoprotein release transport system permease subunit